MKNTAIILTAFPLVGFGQMFNDSFDSEVDPASWTITANTEDKSDVYVSEGVLNFTHTNVENYWGAGIEMEYFKRIPQTDDFTVKVEMENNDLQSGNPYTLIGISIEVPEKGRKIWFDYLSDEWVRMISVFDKRDYFSPDIGQGGPLANSSNPYTFALSYSNSTGIVSFLTSAGGLDFFSGSIGISSNPGTLGTLDWELEESDTFSVFLYSYAGDRNAPPGVLKMDNFSLEIIPEPSFTGLLFGLTVWLLVWSSKRSRTNRWW